ncbi:MAG: hypothetical protein AAF717_17300 [Bacteroidota bacterium]
MHYFLTTVLLAISLTLTAQNFEIHLKNGSEKEKQARKQLERILATYDSKINQWYFTNKIEIDENTIPFSHPTLTLNCNFLNEDVKQLATFLHEQFHWLEEEKKEVREKAIAEFRQIFPEVPVRGGQGARNEYSTYLHFIVCDLELQAMTQVVGEKMARQLLSEWTYYQWIYDKVLNDKRIRAVNTKYGFIL